MCQQRKGQIALPALHNLLCSAHLNSFHSAVQTSPEILCLDYDGDNVDYEDNFCIFSRIGAKCVASILPQFCRIVVPRRFPVTLTYLPSVPTHLQYIAHSTQPCIAHPLCVSSSCPHKKAKYLKEQKFRAEVQSDSGSDVSLTLHTNTWNCETFKCETCLTGLSKMFSSSGKNMSSRKKLNYPVLAAVGKFIDLQIVWDAGKVVALQCHYWAHTFIAISRKTSLNPTFM